MDNLNINDHLADSVYDLAISPNYEKDKICFAARNSGLYRSNDGGHNWKSVFDSLNLNTPLGASCVAVSPDFQEDGQVFAAVQGGILRSEDRGENWTVSILPPPPPFITTLAISPLYKSDGILFAGTMDDGFYRSVDRGARWTAWNFGLFDVHILSLAVSPNFPKDKTIFLGTESGVFCSLNRGLGWREVDFPIGYAPVLSIALSPNFMEDRCVYCGTEDSGLLYSSDAGKTWKHMATAHDVGIVDDIILSPNYPLAPNILVMNSDGLLLSRDLGETWQSWKGQSNFDAQLLSVSAPNGIDSDEPLLVGLANGDIFHV